MNTSALKQGQKLETIWTPLNADGEQAGGWVGRGNVVEIEISQCAGPMGWYDVAIIRHDNGKADVIVPVHMAEYVELLKEGE